jgi:hypothetical protein
MSVLSDYYAKRAAGQPVTQEEIRAAQEALVAERNAYIASHPGTSVSDAGMAVMAANGSPYVQTATDTYMYKPMESQSVGTGGTGGTGGTSTSSGIVPPPYSGTTPGETGEGTVNGVPTTFFWVNGQWTYFPTGDTTDGTGGNTGVTNGGVAGGDQYGFAEQEPFAFWLNNQGTPAIGGSSLQKWKNNQFAPTYSTWLGGSALGLANGGPGLGASFNDYLNGGNNILGARQQALNILKGAGGLGAEGQGIFRSGLSDSELSQLVRNALSAIYAAPVAQRVGNMFGDMEQQYIANTQGTGDTFLSYYMNKLGL